MGKDMKIALHDLCKLVPYWIALRYVNKILLLRITKCIHYSKVRSTLGARNTTISRSSNIMTYSLMEKKRNLQPNKKNNNLSFIKSQQSFSKVTDLEQVIPLQLPNTNKTITTIPLSNSKSLLLTIQKEQEQERPKSKT